MIDDDTTFAASLRRMIAVLVAAVILALGIAARGDTIRLHAQAAAPGPDVRLDDVAVLDGAAAQALADTIVARFDGEAVEKTVSLAELRDRLTEAGVNWGLVSLKGYAACRVHRVGEPQAHVPEVAAMPIASNPDGEVTVDQPASLHALVLDRLATIAGAAPADLRVTFSERDAALLSRASLVDRYEIDIGSAAAVGRVPITIRRYAAPGEEPEAISVTATVEKRVLAVVATQSIGRGERFTADAVELREVYVRDGRGDPVSDLKLVVGQVASGQLREGHPIYASSVQPPLLVRRGELITVHCVSGALVVRTVARAGGDGGLNEAVEVRNESTRQTYLATVTGPRQATIWLTPGTAPEGAPGTASGTAPGNVAGRATGAMQDAAANQDGETR